jgi:hypothetical protein
MNRKEQIAVDFIDLHKSFDYDKDKLETIYNNLVGGVYGEFEDNGMGDMVIEIQGSDRKDGNPFLFEIDKSEMNI